jgi:hypothetical protein
MNILLISLRDFIGVDRLIVMVQVVGYYMILTGFWDAYKYHWQSQSIKKVGLARGHSRKFINAAIHNDHVRVLYLFLSGLLYTRFDWFLISSAVLAIVYMTELFFIIYRYYPYKMRGCPSYRRPNVFIYFINSLIPNKLRKRL